MGITYHAIAESTALEKCAIDRVEYVWRDHWMLVGMITFDHSLIRPHRYHGPYPIHALLRIATDDIASRYSEVTRLLRLTAL